MSVFAALISFGKVQKEVDDPAQQSEHDPIQLAARCPRQDKRRDRRRKGQDNDHQASQENKDVNC